ncbi:MAG: hypothetical protein PHV06_07605 [bacterium]|nr:hypothetical protein [bacterium]
MRIITFALGNIWQWTKLLNRDPLIQYARNLEHIDGIEITFASKNELMAFELSRENRKWLSKQKYVSIHAPFNMLRASQNEKEYRDQLKSIEKIYKETNSKNVVIHPTELPQNTAILKDYKMDISVENMPPVKCFNVVNLGDVLKKNPGFGLCIDVAHAYLWSRDMTKRLVKKFGDRVTQIHLSGTYKRRDHQSLQVVTSNFLKSLEPIYPLSIPIVIEETFKTKNIKDVQHEVTYIKHSIFNGK